jgi:hypothetical protein
MMTQPQPGWFPDPQGKHQWRWWDGAVWTDHIANGDVPGVDAPTYAPGGGAASSQKTGLRRIPAWAWVLIGIAALVLLIFLSPLIAIAALVVLITGIVALVRGKPTWLRLNTRKMALGITAGAAAVLFAASGVSAAVYPNAGTVSEQAAAPLTSSAAPSASPTPKPKPTPVATTREEVVTEPIPFGQVTVQDGAVPSGQTSVTTAGVNGQKSLTYQVNLVDGVEVSRELILEAVSVAPIDEVTTVGTYVAPPPPPPPAAAAPPGGCDSNYADACVPIASDVDCAGGNGNGPAYFGGVARIVGSDIYDLDRDGDGYACEP